jgi:hypothetical protein
LDEQLVTVDLRVDTKDLDELSWIESHMQSLHPTRIPNTRDPVTILVVTASALQLADSIVDLWRSMKKKGAPSLPSVTIEVQSGATIELGTVKSKEEIRSLVFGESATEVP